MEVVKDEATEATSFEEDPPPAWDKRTRNRRRLTSPMELWSSLLLEENQCAADTHGNIEKMRKDMESTEDNAEGMEEGSMVQETTKAARLQRTQTQATQAKTRCGRKP